MTRGSGSGRSWTPSDLRHAQGVGFAPRRVAGHEERWPDPVVVLPREADDVLTALERVMGAWFRHVERHGATVTAKGPAGASEWSAASFRRAVGVGYLVSVTRVDGGSRVEAQLMSRNMERPLLEGRWTGLQNLEDVLREVAQVLDADARFVRGGSATRHVHKYTRKAVGIVLLVILALVRVNLVRLAV